MHNLRGAVEVSTTRSVVTHASTAQSILILLITTLAILFVLVDQVEVAHRNGVQIHWIQLIGEVLVEVFVFRRRLEALLHRHNDGTVWQLFQIVLINVQLHLSTAIRRLLQTTDESPEFGIDRHLRHDCFL